MKPSKLMLKGYAMVGKQCRRAYYKGSPLNPDSVCAIGAYALAKHRNADEFYNTGLHGPIDDANDKFIDLFDIEIHEANDRGMPIEDIAGILAAEGM